MFSPAAGYNETARKRFRQRFVKGHETSYSAGGSGAAGLTINDERKLTVDFSSVYASSTLVIISAEGVAYDSVADLAGKKVGVQQGTSGDLIISDASDAILPPSDK